MSMAEKLDGPRKMDVARYGEPAAEASFVPASPDN